MSYRIPLYLTVFIWICQVAGFLADHTPMAVAEYLWGPI